MREKIVAVIFSIIIIAVPAVTLLQRATAKEDPQTEQEGSIAELSREEQLLMQQALEANEANEATVQESTAAEPEPESESAEDNTEQEEESTPGFLESLKESVEGFAGDLAFQEEAANANSSLTSSLADDAYIESDQVLAGKGGWLFYKRADDGTSMADYQGTSVFSESTMQSIMNQLESQRDIFAARGVEFVVMIVPNKEIIYSEYMPSTVYRTSEITRCDLLYEYLRSNSDLHVVYPKAELLAAKETCQVYYKYDTHWNFAGVYVGVQTLLRELYGTYVDIADAGIVLEAENMSGDLASLVGLQDKYNDDKFYNFYEQNVDPAQKREENLLVVGDSFSDLMMGELDYYFAEVDNVNVWNFTMSDLDRYQPNVVLWECAERYADRLSWINLTKEE